MSTDTSYQPEAEAMSSFRPRWCFGLVVSLFLTLLYFLFVYRLAHRDLWASHEARAAQDAQRMLDDRAWLMPRMFDDRYDYQKPPLFYWMVATIGRMRGGVDAWAVRLPSALAAIGCCVAVFIALHRRGRTRAGLIAAVVLATAQHFTWLGRTGRIDMPLALAVCATLLTVGL